MTNYSTGRSFIRLQWRGSWRFADGVAQYTEREHKLASPSDFGYSALRTLSLSFTTNPRYYENFLTSRNGASKGAALMIVLAFVVLLTGLMLAYFSRTTTDRQLAQSSYNDTNAICSPAARLILW